MPSSTARWTSSLAGRRCFVLSSSTFLLAQSTGGRILGRVADPSGAVLADVKVTAGQRSHRRQLAKPRPTTAATTSFVEVPPGSYRRGV